LPPDVIFQTLKYTKFDFGWGCLDNSNFITSAKKVMFCQTLSVCLSVCQQDNSKSYGRISLKFWGYVGNGTCFNFGGNPKGILDSGLLWNFRYYCFQWGI